jgi:hypothetical protein
MTKMLAGKNKATPKTIKIIMDAIRSGAVNSIFEPEKVL